AGITGFDPLREGRPGSDFPWREYDIVFLDYDLGRKGETGIDWLPGIKSSVPAPSVIMVTGHGSEKIAVRAIRHGADDYLVKYDVVAEKLFEMVEACLAERKTLHGPAVTRPDVQQPESGGGRQDSAGTGAMEAAEKLPDFHRDLPGYQCLALLAQGYNVSTVLAERHADGRRMVIKVLDLPESGVNVPLKRFMQELTILSGLEHPHIIKVRDRGVTEQYFYYAVDFYPEGDLADAISGGGITPAQAVAYILQIADGLTALHRAGILHRDIKPKNILFADAATLVIADLGIAKDLASSEPLTAHGQVIGTPFYMSPEQIESKIIDHRTDIYSLGVLFYELLTGTLPFPGNSILEVAYKHAFDPVPPLPAHLSAWRPVLDRMLAKSPEDRYLDMEQLVHDVMVTGSG
ncbi:MAG: protein kinase domain-containing protein, partial [Gammaproteobacteria bacterium]